MKTVIGIDAGASGGIVIYKKNRLEHMAKMPKKIEQLKPFFDHIRESNDDVIVFIEKVQMFMSDSDAENKGKQFRIAQMLKNYNQLIAFIVYYGFEYIEVYPKSWQSYLGYSYLSAAGTDYSYTDRKNAYKEGAQLCFPSANVTLWNSDALLILKFGLLKLENDQNYIDEKIQNKKRTGLF